MRHALGLLLDLYRRRRTAMAIVRGYRVWPQSLDEVGWADDATVQMIAEEPW